MTMQSEYNDTGTGSGLGALVSGQRYEYDGLNLLRVVQVFDYDKGKEGSNDNQRTLGL
jgi:hypothetical protein